MGNKWARQLADDALAAIDMATSTAWWEYLIEIIPVGGDVYGASQLGKQGYATWRLVKKFESAAEWAGKAASKKWNSLGVNKLIGKGADKIGEYTRKFNNQGSHLSESDLAGAVKEIYGLKSGIKPNGTPYKHLEEVENALSGMKSQIDNLSNDIKKGLFEGDALKAANGILNDVKNQFNNISNTLNSARKAAKEVSS